MLTPLDAANLADIISESCAAGDRVQVVFIGEDSNIEACWVCAMPTTPDGIAMRYHGCAVCTQCTDHFL